jgi:hypothetical protein
MNRHVGNLAPMPGVFPDYPAPVLGLGSIRRRGLPFIRSTTLPVAGRSFGVIGLPALLVDELDQRGFVLVLEFSGANRPDFRFTMCSAAAILRR